MCWIRSFQARRRRVVFASRTRGLAGFTTIELMVSLAIALLVVGALSQAMLAALRSDRYADALAQVTDDAGFALAVMRQQVAQAGFSVPQAVESPASAPSPAFALHVFPPVLGCAGANFRDIEASILAPPACGAASPDPSAADALEVAYEASVLPGSSSNAILGGRDAAEPLDCLGNSFAKTPDAAGGDYYLNDSKFYVDGGSLFCHGPGNAAGAALAQNVETLRVAYGMSAAAAGQPGADQVAYYDVAPPIGAPEWADVVAIRLCVQVRSAAKVLDAESMATLGAYVDCGNVRRTSNDGVLRRTFSTTVVLQNRLP